jgi:hypothetical protein
VRKGVYLILLILLIYIPFVSSAPPVTTVQQIVNGYTIIDSPQTIFKQGQNYQYNFFVVNISNGALKLSDITSCIFYLANSSGEVIFYNSVPYKPEGYWGIDILGGNFSNIGFYNFGARCNSSTLAGATSGLWEVTATGMILSSVQVSVYILFLLLCLVLTFFSVKLFQNNKMSKDVINYSELYETKKRNEFAYYVELIKKKLWIVGVFGVYLSIFLFTSLSQQLTYNLGVTDTSSILQYINIGLAWGLVPFTIFWFVWLIFTFYKTTTETLKYQFGNFRSGK